MLPRKNRVGKQYFPPAHVRGRSVFSDLFTLKTVPLKDPSLPTRFAVVVSAKVAKQAVARNKLRRRVYEAIQAGGGVVSHGQTCIFYAKKGSGGAPYSQITQEVTKLLLAHNKKP